jgi:hypothetical protein
MNKGAISAAVSLPGRCKGGTARHAICGADVTLVANGDAKILTYGTKA